MRRLAALAAILLLAAPATTAAQDGWTATLTQRPSDQVIEGFMWAAAGCFEKAGQILSRPDLRGGEHCDALPLPLPLGRRIFEMGTVSGAMRWCDDDPSIDMLDRPWTATMARLTTTPEGGKWPGDLRRFVMTLHGTGQGWAMARLSETRGVCTPDQRTTALSEMNDRIARYRDGH